MSKEFEILGSEKIIGLKKLLNDYKMNIGDQKVGIKTYIDSNGYYQMETSHYYLGGGKASVYINSAANFRSEEEALIHAERQLLSFYDGKGEWRKNDNYNL